MSAYWSRSGSPSGPGRWLLPREAAGDLGAAEDTRISGDARACPSQADPSFSARVIEKRAVAGGRTGPRHAGISPSLDERFADVLVPMSGGDVQRRALDGRVAARGVRATSQQQLDHVQTSLRNSGM